MKTLLLTLLTLYIALPVFAQSRDPFWRTKIRKDSYYGLALSAAPVYETAISDANTVTTISPYDSIQFIHEMNGFWYVNTDKGIEGYVKGVEYRVLNLDSLEIAAKLAEQAKLEAKLQAARDSVAAAEHRALVYASVDSATAERILQKNIWQGMTRQMAELSIGKPLTTRITFEEHDSTSTGVETWIYPQTYLYFSADTVVRFADAPADIPILPDVPVTETAGDLNLQPGDSSVTNAPASGLQVSEADSAEQLQQSLMQAATQTPVQAATESPTEATPHVATSEPGTEPVSGAGAAPVPGVPVTGTTKAIVTPAAVPANAIK